MSITASLTASFSASGPGGDLNVEVDRDITLTGSEIADPTVPISSGTETTVWQSKNNANGSPFTPEFAQLLITVFPADGDVLTSGTDIFQIGLYTTPVAGGSATHRITLTVDGDFFLSLSSLLMGASTVVPSGSAVVHALTKVTASRQAGTKTARVRVTGVDG